MTLDLPRLVIAGLAGDSGKTLVALGLARALQDRGSRVAAAKKGPDYIDAAWLGVASRRPGRNLDAFLMDERALGEVLRRASEGAEFLVIEGNRGLHDGLDAHGSYSSAELAKRLAAPVILVVDVTKMTRTAAALVAGCAILDPELELAGVILNQVATRRQEAVIREAITQHTRVPVLGAIPRLSGATPLPGRHLGLVTAVEHPEAEGAIRRAAEVVAEHVDLEGLERIARRAKAVLFPPWNAQEAGLPLRVGVFRDEAFSFYYPENLESLEAAGAELVPISPLHEERLPEIDGLYLGGGFPEVHASRLAANVELARQVAQAARAGLPVYAECGGLMYLARELRAEGKCWPMSGVLDLVVEQKSKPQGHGYVVAKIDRKNPFFAEDECLRGHEFHYSRVVKGEAVESLVAVLERGQGVHARRDGIVSGAIWASYLHLHAMSTPGWADGFLDLARARRSTHSGSSQAWA